MDNNLWCTRTEGAFNQYPLTTVPDYLGCDEGPILSVKSMMEETVSDIKRSYFEVVSVDGLSRPSIVFRSSST